MKRTGLLFLIMMGCFSRSKSVSLDGTTNVIFQSASYPFSNGDFARGFVRLNDGFSVPAASTVNLNVLVPVAGDINTTDGTGTLFLEDDLSLASNATISNGATIDGQGNTLFLNNDLTITASKKLVFTSNTIIDGQGHDVFLQDGSPGGQLLINGASGTTVTLRNMNLHGVREFTGPVEALAFGASTGQGLVLENVTIFLSQYILFTGGSLTIAGSSKISGPYEFDYQAPYNITILNDAQLMVGLNCALLYRPSDTLRTHLVFTTNTSTLFLNGSTLFTPKTTGLRLLDGQLIINNQANLQSDLPAITDKIITIGNGNAARDLSIALYPGAGLNVVDAIVEYKNQD